jgi:hypothetical protein
MAYAVDTTNFATRRRNVKPTSSILRTVTRDIDCTAAAFEHPPEDGQFIVANGQTGDNPFGSVFAGTNEAAVDATFAMGSSLKMVWASAMQSDRQALGDKRVPVLWQGGIEVECKLFNSDANVAMSALYPIGSLVTVAANPTAVALKPGSATSDVNKRLVLQPYPVDKDGGGPNEATAWCGWVVGYVTALSNTGVPVAGDSITVMLYEQPRYMQKAI